MKLLDFLTIANENKTYYIKRNGGIVGIYDGKNSIDAKWNNHEMSKIEWLPGDQILVVLK